jgi:hypothetical protein
MSYSLPKFTMLNFRSQGDITLSESQRMNNSTGKQETFNDLSNDAGYAYKLMTPPCVAEWPHIGEGGNFMKSKFSKTESTSNIMATLLKTGGSEEHQSERDDFFARMDELNKSALDQMYDKDIGGAATAARSKASRYYKSKTPEEQEAKARESFHKGAMIPLKTKDGVEKITIKCRAFNKDGSARPVRYVHTAGGQYEEMKETPEVYNGALLSMVFTMRPYCMSKDKYGITYTLTPDIVVYATGTAGRSSIPMDVIETPNREYKFNTTEGKEGKFYVNVTDVENRRFTTRIQETELEWNDLQSGTLGKFSGVTPATAKFTGTLKEDTSNPASVAMFDYYAKLVEDGVQHCLNDSNLLKKAKEELAENAKEVSADTGESYESTFRTMVDDIFNSPVVKKEDNDYRQLKITQRQYPYNDEETPNVIPLQDVEGNDVTETIELQRGAKIAPVIRPSFYFMPDGGFGLKFEVSLQYGIKVHSNPDAIESGGGGVLYEVSKRSADDSADVRSPKRARTE